MSKRPWARLRKIGSNGVFTNRGLEVEPLRDLVHDVDVEALVVGRSPNSNGGYGMSEPTRSSPRLIVLRPCRRHRCCRRRRRHTRSRAARRGDQGNRRDRGPCPQLAEHGVIIGSTPPGRLPYTRMDGAGGRAAAARPYLDALRAYAARSPGRFHVPGHKGGAAADPVIAEAFGERALRLDIPALTEGIDAGPEPTPFQRAQELAARGLGRRAHLVPDQRRLAGQPRGLPGARAVRRASVVVQRNVHSSTIDGLSCPGCGRRSWRPEIDPDLGIAHCLTPEALDRALAATPDAVGAMVVSPTYFGAVADVRGPRARSRTRTACRWWSTRPGARTSPSAPRCPSTRSRAAPTSSCRAPTRSSAASPSRRCSTSATADGSTSTSSTARSRCSSRPARARCCCGSLDAARSLRGRCSGATCSTRRVARARQRAAGDPRRSRASTCSTSGSRRGRACTPTTRCGSSSTCAAPARRGYQVARLLHERDIFPELAGENVIVAVFGMGETASDNAARLVEALEQAVGAAPRRRGRRASASSCRRLRGGRSR